LTSLSTETAPALTPPVSKILLRPRSGWQPIDLKDLWNYRELLVILAMRDIKVRYKQTVLGAAWAIIQPLFSTVLFTVLFSGYAPPGIRAPLFFFAGSIQWQLFASAVGAAGNSLVGNQNLITKIYFPRLVIPMASVITTVIDFCIAFAILLVMMACYRTMPSAHIVFVPVFVLLGFLASLAVGLWLSALNVEFRDVRFVIPFMIQAWMFLTPVIYPASHFSNPWMKALLAINPMSGVVEGFRWCMFGQPAPGRMLAASVATILVLLVGGLFFFRRMEKTFADLV
jgi:lipopolysaccharide transport system permease protein